MTDYNLLLDVDSYKSSHYLQTPKNTTSQFSYIESRGGKFDRVVVFGYGYILRKYLSVPITMEMINEAEMEFKLQGMPFNREGWEYILKEHGGKLPLKIRAMKEGTVATTKSAIMTIESTDPKCSWIVGYIEPMLLRVWYPITVATLSYHIMKDLIQPAVVATSDDVKSAAWKLHDFGARASTSYESSMIAGAAHLLSFSGTDTISCHSLIRKYYGGVGFLSGSVPASEHSTMTSWGREHEIEAYRNMLNVFASNDSEHKSPIFACVSDAYDIINAVENIWGKELKGQIKKSDTIISVRPDSGSPLYMVMMTIDKLDKAFGHTVNSKGFKVLNNVRVVQGDGVDYDSIKEIIEYIVMSGYSIDNIVFGMGGALHQKVNRDTQKFALKCSAVEVDGEWRDVYKDPITDKGKMSKKGRLDTYWDYTKAQSVTVSGSAENINAESILHDVFFNGDVIEENMNSFEDIKKTIRRFTPIM